MSALPDPRAAARRAPAAAGAVREPGEAGFFFHDAHFDRAAVKVLPGEYFVGDGDIVIMTTLGSCIAACLWDRERRIGGMNHFMLPGDDGMGGASGRYGWHAMELLIDALLVRGATRNALEAKVFGGAQLIDGARRGGVGARNTDFVLAYLRSERIPVVSMDVHGWRARKLCFLPASGRALVKRLAPSSAAAVLDAERLAAARAAPLAGAVDLLRRDAP